MYLLLIAGLSSDLSLWLYQICQKLPLVGIIAAGLVGIIEAGIKGVGLVKYPVSFKTSFLIKKSNHEIFLSFYYTCIPCFKFIY
jgi:hypothetical protein